MLKSLQAPHGLSVFFLLYSLVNNVCSQTHNNNNTALHFSNSNVSASIFEGALQGTCRKDQTFPPITSVKDIKELQNDLECIFAAGIVPSTIPLGPYYGNVFQLANTAVFNPILDALWKGKLATHFRCGAKPIYMSWNIIGDRASLPAALHIGHHGLHLVENEYDDGRPSLIIDYTVDFSQVCFLNLSSTSVLNEMNLNVFNNIFPFNHLVDVVRLVGRTENLEAIYLGKTYMIDDFSESKKATTVAFWAIRASDAQADPNFHYKDSLPPLAEGFHYTRQGLIDFVSRMSPVHGFLHNPSAALKSLVQQVQSIEDIYTTSRHVALRRGIKKIQENMNDIRDYLASLMSSESY